MVALPSFGSNTMWQTSVRCKIDSMRGSYFLFVRILLVLIESNLIREEYRATSELRAGQCNIYKLNTVFAVCALVLMLYDVHCYRSSKNTVSLMVYIASMLRSLKMRTLLYEVFL